MSYSCADFADSILDALKIEVAEQDWDDPSAQADLALDEIERLQAAAAIGSKLLAALKPLVRHAEQSCEAPSVLAVAVAAARAAIAEAEEG